MKMPRRGEPAGRSLELFLVGRRHNQLVQLFSIRVALKQRRIYTVSNRLYNGNALINLSGFFINGALDKQFQTATIIIAVNTLVTMFIRHSFRMIDSPGFLIGIGSKFYFLVLVKIVERSTFLIRIIGKFRIIRNRHFIRIAPIFSVQLFYTLILCALRVRDIITLICFSVIDQFRKNSVTALICCFQISTLSSQCQCLLRIGFIIFVILIIYENNANLTIFQHVINDNTRTAVA
ncbi:MAG: hypothetical protein BHW25_04350 [Faecalibacterium sp. CAG:82-related_59_9]|nr:MAG: hypothetical protein BHW25_04350 [Faecalibacterium sp. CAG:82-related_59_9]